jgi:hypothetical protein
MIGYERLAEQHIREHQARQLKLDEIDAVTGGSRHQSRPTMPTATDETWRLKTISSAGPMGIWDVVAQDLEGVIELFENAPTCELRGATASRRFATLHSL